MKKQFILTALLISSLGFIAEAQGNFNFSSGNRFVWNNAYAPAIPGGPFNVAFLWSANLSATNLVTQLTGHSIIPTNNSTGGGAQGPSYLQSSVDWNAILSDPNFQFGRDANTGNIAVGTLTAVGGISYNLGSPFGVSGTSTAGGSVMAFFIGWNNAFSTPQLAAAAGSVLGWSGTFRYDYANNATSPSSMGLQAVQNGPGDPHFGLGIPEPTTFMLTCLGAAILLLFRRSQRQRR